MADSAQVLRRWVLYPAASLVIGLALLIGVLRLLLPVVPRYQAEIRTWASRATGLNIGFRNLSASWPLSGPALSLYGVTIADPSTGKAIIQAGEFTVGVSLWRVLRDREVMPARVRLRGSRLAIDRDAEGRITVQGRFLSELIRSRPDRKPDVALELQELQIDFHDRISSRALGFSIDDSELDILPADFRLAAALRLPREYGGRMNVAAAVPGGLLLPGGGFRKADTWKAGFSGPDIDVVRVLELVLNDHRPLVAARGNLSAGVAVARGMLGAVSIDANLHDVRLARGNASGVYQTIAGRLTWNRHGRGWDAVARQFVMRRAERTWPVSEGEAHFQAASESAPAEWRARAKFIRLEDLYPLAQTLAAETELADQLPSVLSGDIRDLDAESAASAEAPTRFALHLGFDQLAYTDHSGGIAVAGLRGSLGADGDGGRLQLDCKGASVALPDWIADKLTADELKGLLVWRSGAQGLRIVSDDIRFTTAGIGITSRVELNFPADSSSPAIDMKASARARDTREVLRYLPLRKFPPRVGMWLQRAIVGGEVSEASLVLRGPLREFPFDYSHAQAAAQGEPAGRGVFHVDLGLKDATLDYADNWPRVEQLTGHFILDGVSLSSTQNHARVGALEVTDFDVHIPDLRHGVLEISGRAQTGLNNVLAFLRETPVATAMGPTFSRLTASGPVVSQLKLTLPLGSPRDYDLQVQTETQSASLGLEGVPLTLEKLRGRVNLHNARLSGQNIAGELLGEPVVASIEPQADEQSKWTHTAELRGGAPVARITETFRLPFREQFTGHLDYTATAYFPSKKIAAPEPFRLDLRTNLRGVTSALPRPFAKSPELEWPAKVTLAFPKEGLIDISGELQTPLAFALRLQNAALAAGGAAPPIASPAPAAGTPRFAVPNAAWRVERGTINADSQPAALPAQPGVELGGGLAELRVADWIRLANASAGETSSAEPRPLRDLYRSATLGVGRLVVAGLVFRDAYLNARRMPTGWVIDVESPEAVGRVTVPFELKPGAPIALDMERLWLFEREVGQGGERAERADPRATPALEIRVEDAALGKWHIGGLQTNLIKTTDGLIAKPIVVRGTSFSADGEGGWRVDPAHPDSQESEIRLSVDSTDVADTLEQLGFDKIMAGKAGKLKVGLRWPGGPSADFLDDASGTLGLEIRKGEVLDIEPGTGRLLGLISVAALPRRLALDFRDVFNKGLAFDTIRGDFKLVSGNAYTCNLGLEGPVADMGIIGRAGFRAKDYDQLAVVRPQVGNVLPVLGGAVLGGPIGGVTMLLISQVFRKPLSTLGESYYRVSGQWEKPAVDRIQRNQVESARFKDCEKELAETLDKLPAPAEFPAPTAAPPPRPVSPR
jgi:uncharacterized protein YhdP